MSLSIVPIATSDYSGATAATVERPCMRFALNRDRVHAAAPLGRSDGLRGLPKLNPFIRSITGSAQTGGKLTVAIQPSGGKAMTFRPTVLVSKAHSEFRWLGHFLFRGVFDGEHYFEITPIAAGAVRFVQGEKFSGALVGLAKSSLDRGTKAGFIA